MKKPVRVAAMVKILSDHPGRLYSTSYFCERFGVAKSTVSEDTALAASAMRETGSGCIETLPGAGGGIRYVPHITDAQCRTVQEALCRRLQEPSRLMGGGILYVADIVYDPSLAADIARVFARRFRDTGASFVATIETKGIPLAFLTAHYMGIPLAVVRRRHQISEGPTMSINYFSASTEKMQQMSLSKKAVTPGSHAVIIDDFMRVGGSIRGIAELLSEFDIQVSGIGVAVSTAQPAAKKIHTYTSLVTLQGVDEEQGIIDVVPNDALLHTGASI